MKAPDRIVGSTADLADEPLVVAQIEIVKACRDKVVLGRKVAVERRFRRVGGCGDGLHADAVGQKASGSWEARYRDPEGHQRGKSFPTKKATKEFLARVAVDVQRGEYVSPDNARRPLGPIAEEWVASLCHLKPRTLMNYENTLRYHVLPRLGETPVGAIDQRRVRRFITDMLGDGVSPAQVRKAVGRLKQTLDLAVELGTVRKNPCVGVKLPSMPHEEVHFLTADQIATLADGMPEPYDLMVRFAAYTGLRAGEIVALRRRHLRLDDAKVVVLTMCLLARLTRSTSSGPRTRPGTGGAHRLRR